MNILTNLGFLKMILPNSTICFNIKKKKINTSGGEIKDGGRDNYKKKCGADTYSVKVMMSMRRQVINWKRLIVKYWYCLFL